MTMNGSKLAMVLTIVSAVGAIVLGGCEEQKKDAAKAIKDAAAAAKTAVTDTATKAVEGAKVEAGKMMEAAKEKVAELTGGANKSVEAYISDLGRANGILGGINAPMDATQSLPDLKLISEKLNSASDALHAMGTDVKDQIQKTFGPQIEPLVATFKGHIERLSKDSMIGPVLGDTLKSVELFE